MSAPVRCDCGKFFVWAETPDGNRMPIDPAPVANGTLELVRRPGEEQLARYVKPGQRPGRTDLYVTHFATCQNAAQHRQRRPVAAGRWLAANSPADQPYPCRCHSDHVGCRAGGNHCPCRGRTDLDHLPAACCAKLAARQSTKESR